MTRTGQRIAFVSATLSLATVAVFTLRAGRDFVVEWNAVGLLESKDPRAREAAWRRLVDRGCERALPGLLRARVRGLVNGGSTQIDLEEVCARRGEAVVSHLVPLLQEPELRADALALLIEVGPRASAAIPAAAALLEDRDRLVRVRAAYALYEMGGDQRILLPTLSAALLDPDPKVRDSAAQAFYWIGEDGRAAIPQLLRCLRLPSTDRHCPPALSALISMGKEAALPVGALLRDPDEAMRRHAARILGSMGSGAVDATPLLIDALRDGVEEVQVGAAQALGRIGPAAREAEPALMELLRSGHEPPAKEAEAALRGIRGEPKEVFPLAIGDGLRHQNAAVRVGALKAIILMDRVPAEHWPEIEAHLDDENPLVRSLTRCALLPLRPELRPGLIADMLEQVRAVDFQETREVQDAVFILGRLGCVSREVVPAVVADALKRRRCYSHLEALKTTGVTEAEAQPLRDALLGPDDHQRFLAAYLLSEIGVVGLGVVPAVVEALRRGDALTRECALKALAGAGAEAAPAVPGLKERLLDTRRRVRWEARQALRRLFRESRGGVPGLNRAE